MTAASGLAHEAHAAASEWLPLCAGVAAVVSGYLFLAARQRAPRWSARRTASFVTGCAVVAVAVLPAASPFAADDFRMHMLQHLLIGMVAPTALVLGAPATLVLRSLSARWRRPVARMLRSRTVRALTQPVTVLLLTTAGLVVLYVTPLHTATSGSPVLHQLVHLHFLVSGYVFAWLVVGPDPAPHRPSVPARLVLLGIAIAAHAVLSQLLYAGLLGGTDIPADQRRGAAVLMYYGGDAAELVLAFALVSTWRPRRRPTPVTRTASGRAGRR